MKLAVLQTGRSPKSLRADHGDYDDMCAALISGAPYDSQSFAVLDGDFPENSADFDAFLVTGSPHGAYESHSWIKPLETLIQGAFEANKKIIGLCFGHQIVAQALGGRVEKSEKGYGIGVMGYELIDANGHKDSVSLHAWHQDQVTEIPKRAQIIAQSSFCPIAGLRYGDRALTFQAHPEFTREFMIALTTARRGDTVSHEAADIALTSLKRDVDSDKIEKILIDFLTLQ